MKIRLLLIAALLLPLLLITQQQELDKSDKYQEIFKEAEALFNSSEATETTDSIALSLYESVTTRATLSAKNASFLFNCFERAGILKQGLDFTSDQILEPFYNAFAISKKFSLPDSIQFRIYLSAGNVHYGKGLFDSSIYYFNKAEKIITAYPACGKAEDLYNSMGAIYSEAGDYHQSINYFSKALEITRINHPEMKEALFAMSMNIASSLRLSGNLDSAGYLYKNLLKGTNNKAPVFTNLARIYQLKHKPDSALYFLRQVDIASSFNPIALYNSTALCFMQMHKTDSAAIYLVMAKEIHESNGTSKDIFYGSSCRYFGDLEMMKGNSLNALLHYQEALVQLDDSFNSKKVEENPNQFSGSFASYDLLETMLAKAVCLTSIYTERKNPEYFSHTIKTYKTAFALADYIKKSYNTDESRLFMAEKVFTGYKNAVDFLMTNYQQHPVDSIVLLAVAWISKSKAASLAINLKENNIKQYAGIPDSLLQKERDLKFSLSRNKLLLSQISDETEKNKISSTIISIELALNKIFNAYKNFPSYFNQQFAADSFSIKEMQSNTLDRNTGVLCYYRGADNQYVYLITKEDIYVHTFNADSNYNKRLHEYSEALNNFNLQQSTSLSGIGLILYDSLVGCFKERLSGLKSLVIIPDENLLTIPFESFKMSDKEYLVEKYIISYHYALPLLNASSNNLSLKDELAFAPFASKSKNNNSVFMPLPASEKEISIFEKSHQLIDTAATKEKFLQQAPNSKAIHLATHAVVNYNNPENSFIVFYPQGKKESEYKLYANEIYNLALQKTNLIFLSACETGTGKRSISEGALSLARAFAFAGCPDIITSLWKAEDESTAYISQRFYYHSSEGNSYAEAMQKAKIDFLANPSFSQFHSPQYWSHLIYIGDIQNEKDTLWQIISFCLVGFVIIAVLIYKYRSRIRYSKKDLRN